MFCAVAHIDNAADCLFLAVAQCLTRRHIRRTLCPVKSAFRCAPIMETRDDFLPGVAALRKAYRAIEIKIQVLRNRCRSCRPRPALSHSAPIPPDQSLLRLRGALRRVSVLHIARWVSRRCLMSCLRSRASRQRRLRRLYAHSRANQWVSLWSGQT